MLSATASLALAAVLCAAPPPAEGESPPAAAPPQPQARPQQPPPAAPLPPPWAEEPIEPAPKTGDLKVATDGKGLFLIYPAKFESFSQRLFAGDGRTFFAQRVVGGGTAEGNYYLRFWDPRIKDFKGGGFDYKAGVPSLECGKKTYTLTELSAAEATRVLSQARLLKPRWRRQGHAYARDDAGTYYYVDRAREPEDTEDYRLYLGAKGKLQAHQVTEHVSDDAAEIFVSPAGSLKHSRVRPGEAEWVPQGGQPPVRLSWIPIERQARFVYTELGVYAGERLGTACDGKH